MGPDPARLGLFESEGEGIKRLRRSKPDEAVGSFLYVDPEIFGVGFAEPAVDAVGGDHQVPLAPVVKARIAFRLIMDFDAQLASPGRQYFEQALAANPDESMTGRSDARPMDVDVDIVPMGKFVGDDLAGSWIVRHQILNGLIGKDYAPAEGDAFGVTFEHMHFVTRVAKLHRDGEIEAGRASADAGNLQARPSR